VLTRERQGLRSQVNPGGKAKRDDAGLVDQSLELFSKLFRHLNEVSWLCKNLVNKT
jgi:hypothetical protein